MTPAERARQLAVSRRRRPDQATRHQRARRQRERYRANARTLLRVVAAAAGVVVAAIATWAGLVWLFTLGGPA